MKSCRRFAGLCVLSIGAAVAQNASGPWTVTVAPPNPLRIGICAAVQLTVKNAAGTDVPRNGLGQRITVADFDMTVIGASVAGRRIDAYHFEVCGCQGATPGSVAKIKASYPAKSLAPAAVVPNVHIEREVAFSIGTRIGQANPPACTAPPPVSQQSAQPVAQTSSAAPSPQASAPPAAAVSPSAPTPASPATSAPPASTPSPSPEAPAPVPDMPVYPDFPTLPEMPNPDALAPELLPEAVDVGQADDPLAMFAALMPVFSSPRCVNCHGGTNPQTNFKHKGGQQDVVFDADGDMGSNEDCVACHDVPDARHWRLAPKRFSFVEKDSRQLCRQFRSGPGRIFDLAVPEDRAQFLEHLRDDPLIVVAFVGESGISRGNGAYDEVTKEPPPMSHAQFLNLARIWLEDGEGACANDWNGTITETTTAQQEASFAPAAGGRLVKTDARVAITVVKSKATADVRYGMQDFTDVPTRECATYNHQTWSALTSRLPVELAVVASNESHENHNTAAPSSRATTHAGTNLPPGVTLPPGVELPPGFVMPSTPSVGENFFRYAAPKPVAGTHRSDIRSLPGCRQDVAEDRYAYHLEGALVTLQPASKAQPNRYKGQKVIDIAGGKKTIEWDLTHIRE